MIKKILVAVFVFAVLLTAKVALAEDLIDPSGVKIMDVINSGIKVAMWAAGIITTVLILVGGFQYMFAGSSKEGATKAKQTLTYAIIGLVIVLAAFSISSLVEKNLITESGGEIPSINTEATD